MLTDEQNLSSEGLFRIPGGSCGQVSQSTTEKSIGSNLQLQINFVSSYDYNICKKL
jgi:hypothetical protein